MKNSHHHQSDFPSQPSPERASPFLNFSTEELVPVTYDQDQERSVIRLDGVSIYYPEATGKESRLSKMLLDRDEKGRLLLPKNYITLGQALNDAAGSMNRNKGLGNARMLLEELGTGLREIAEVEHKVPDAISYLNVIYSREEEGAKLLPPVNFVDFDAPFLEQAKSHVSEMLWQSLEAGAANVNQQTFIVDAFGGFVKEFNR